MGIYVNSGDAGFRISIQSEIYVDKTELIKQTNRFINTNQRYICISRPRRFGKTMAVQMLTAYYEKDHDASALFAPYKIAKSPCYKKHLNQYNVIVLNMQNFLSITDTMEEMLHELQSRVVKELKKMYQDILSNDIWYLRDALQIIYNETKENFIIIIDEWDCVLREKQNDIEEHKKYLDFLRDLLKDQNYVALAYMTGILPIKKYGTHSALNMFSEFSMLSPKAFTEYIGFTEEEVQELCEQYQMDFNKMKSWYDGYTFKKEAHVYSPKSVVEALLAEEFDNYWNQTETYEALKKYIDLNFDGLKDAVIQMLTGGRVKINSKLFHNDMTTFKSKDDVLTLLVHLGYLAYDSESSQVFIPNSEITSEFENAIQGGGWEEVVYALEQSEKL